MLSDLELLNKAEENLEWFKENFSKIQERYPGKVIAIKDKKIIDSTKNSQQLLESLKNKRIDDSEVIIERISPKGEIRIL